MLSKAHPEERVGVFARKNGKVEVVEYSELDPSEAAATFDGKSPPSKLLAEGCCSTSLAAACAASAAALQKVWSYTCFVVASQVKVLPSDHARS